MLASPAVAEDGVVEEAIPGFALEPLLDWQEVATDVTLLAVIDSLLPLALLPVEALLLALEPMVLAASAPET